MEQKPTHARPKIGDIVTTDRWHGNYRPTLVGVEDDGETGLVLTTVLGGEPTRVPMAELRKAPPPKKTRRRR